jgi:hypothetical protein
VTVDSARVCEHDIVPSRCDVTIGLLLYRKGGGDLDPDVAVMPVVRFVRWTVLTAVHSLRFQFVRVL